MKKERIGLVVAVLLIVWLSAALVRVENERYAMQVGKAGKTYAAIAQTFK